MAKKQQDENPPHHVISAVVALIAVVGLVVVFQNNGPTGSIVESHRNLPAEVGGWRYTQNLVLPQPNAPRAHWDYCMHGPGDLNYKACCPGGLNDPTCDDPCPSSKSSSPTSSEFTGNCCFQINRAPRCETWGDVAAASARNTKECIESPTQEGTWLC